MIVSMYRNHDGPGNSVGRSCAPHTEPVSSLQWPTGSILPCGPLLCVIPSLSPPFPVNSSAVLSKTKDR